MSDVTLSGELAAVRGELVRVDGKCSTLAGLTGAALAFLVSLLSGHHAHNAEWWCCCGSALLLTSAVLVLLSVLRPRLGSTGFRRYATMRTADIRDLFLTGHASGGVVVVSRIDAEDLQVLSQITNRKYLGLRVAVDLTAVAIALLGFAVLAGVAA